MSNLQIALLILIFIGTFSFVVWITGTVAANPTHRRLNRLVGTAQESGPRASKQWVDRVAHATRSLAKLSLPEEGYESSALRRRFMNAGIRSASAPMAYFGLKTTLALGLPLIAFAVMRATNTPLKGTGLMFLLLASAIGYYLPNYVLSKAVQRRQREVFESFPDALDLMTVCMEAGLGTEAALSKVADEIGQKSPILSEELYLVNLELRAGGSRERALRNLALRTAVDEVEGFVSMIIQAERFGTSIAQSLRVHADTVRARRRQKAEEAATKVPLKLLFPLIFCIFPALMLVIMGPAVIQMIRTVMPAMAGHG